jgi:hypothetical protein
MQDGTSDLRRKIFQVVQCAAGRDPSLFQKRRIQQERATIDEGMIRRFKWFAVPAR